MFAEYREFFQGKIRKTDLGLVLEFRCHAQLETSLQFGMTDRGVAYFLHLNRWIFAVYNRVSPSSR